MAMNVIDLTVSSESAKSMIYDSEMDEDVISEVAKINLRKSHGITGDICFSTNIAAVKGSGKTINYNQLTLNVFNVKEEGFNEIEGKYIRLHFDFDFKNDDEALRRCLIVFSIL